MLLKQRVDRAHRAVGAVFNGQHAEFAQAGLHRGHHRVKGLDIQDAAARQQAVARRVGALAELLQAPNNILAVEYLKAIFDQRLDLHPLTILRTGAQHDRFAEGNIRSASELRMRIGAGEDVSAFLPCSAAEICTREKMLGRGPVLPEALESALLSRLRMLPHPRRKIRSTASSRSSTPSKLHHLSKTAFAPCEGGFCIL